MTELRKPAALITFKDLQGREVRVPLFPPKMTVGKMTDNDLCLSRDPAVSRRHCEVRVQGSDLVLYDLGSSNGTYVDGKRIEGPTPLLDGSMVLVGRTRLFIMAVEENEQEYATQIVPNQTQKGSILIPPTTSFEQHTKAYLVADLVRSTQLLAEYGENYVGKIVSTLGQVIERSLWKEKEPFLQCTGDGFFAAFATVEASLNAVADIQRHHESLYPEDIQLSLALHWGPANYAPNEGMIGKHIHGVFSLEGLRGREPKIQSIYEAEGVQTLILVTSHFAEKLRIEEMDHVKSLGSYELKGFRDPVEVYRWV
ncbi:MAG: FHA domain-containing protein [Candidatus Omnitrophica bacterium]|nr:FHA domain-containing protein [Candidatus Omnitrophota bacterium]